MDYYSPVFVLLLVLLNVFVSLYLVVRFIHACDDLRFLADCRDMERTGVERKRTPIFPFVMVVVLIGCFVFVLVSVYLDSAGVVHVLPRF